MVKASVNILTWMGVRRYMTSSAYLIFLVTCSLPDGHDRARRQMGRQAGNMMMNRVVVNENPTNQADAQKKKKDQTY